MEDLYGVGGMSISDAGRGAADGRPWLPSPLGHSGGKPCRCAQVLATAEIVCCQPGAAPQTPLSPFEDHGGVSGLHTSSLSSRRPGTVTWQLAEASDVWAHEYQSGWVIHRKRSPDWLISNAFTPNWAWGSRATAAGRCGHDVTRIGKPDSRAAGSEAGGTPSSLEEWVSLAGGRLGAPAKSIRS